MNTVTAKMNLLYTLKNENFKYSLLLDLEKAFNKVNHSKLRWVIDITIHDQNDKKLLYLILDSYSFVNMSLIDTTIQPK